MRAHAQTTPRPRHFSVAAAIAILLSAVALPSAAEPLSLSIVHVNDWGQMAGTQNLGGAARIAAVASEEQARAESGGGHTIVTFGGDMISPSLLSGIDKGAHMIALADAIGFDVAVLGNHEFDFGPDELRARLSESGITWLAGNVRFEGQPGFPGALATTVVERGGYRIGFLGLVTPDTVELSRPGHDVTFVPIAEAGAVLASQLKEADADLVIALSHNELSRDLELLAAVKEIDIVLGGHDHLLVAWYDGQQAVMKAGSQGRHVGVLDLRIDRAQDGAVDPVVWIPSFRLRSTAGIEGDAAIAAAVNRYQERLDRDLGVAIGETETELDTRRASVRSREAAFGNLLADAMRAATESDVALTNGGGIRGDTVYPPGTPITRKLVLTELPFGNRTVKLRVMGAQIREALENGVSRIERGAGRFPHVSGLAFAFDAIRPAGARVTRVTVDGVTLDARRAYVLATNDFLANGGDGYAMFRSAEVLIDSRSGELVAGQLIDHILAAGAVSPATEGRIVRER